MSDQGACGDNLFSAAKQLAETEIHLIKVIEGTRKSNRKVVTSSMTTMVKNPPGKKTSRSSNVRPSAALIAAKREAAQRKLVHGKKPVNNILRDFYQKAIDAQVMTRKETGLVYEPSMAEHRCLWDKSYPECPERFTRILERCMALGLVDRCKSIKPRNATHEELLLQHTEEQIEILKATDGCIDEESLEKLSSKYDAIYIHPTTYRLSLLAAGSTINLLENICNGKVQNGMAIIRPPGHHAMKAEYCGYCFFNNVAIAANKMLDNNLANRILIVDWDVHHGQATQQMFYDDPRVVYFSIHRYEHGEFWPNLRESNFNYVGEGKGEGYNFNVPLNKTGMTNADYLAIFQQLLMPMAYEFQPDLVIVSAGYDAALGCPEGEMEVTPACYAHLLNSLLSLAGGKVAVVLEGGYCLKSLAEGAALTLRTLLGDPCPMMQPLEKPSKSIQETILNVIYMHKSYWTCYQYQETYSYHAITNDLEENTNRHLPVVLFRGDETKPDLYATRDCYPSQSEDFLSEIDVQLDLLIEFTYLGKAPNKVCVVYDDRMLSHTNIPDSTHPEKPERIAEIFAKHEKYGLLKRCHLLKGRTATEIELALAHSKAHIETMKKTASTKLRDLTKQASELRSVYLHTETWNSARVSVGSLLQAVDSVLNGESQSGVAIVRPPGHHAEEEAACGFCIFNNVAVAARYAVENFNLKRVLIVDWDIHHGNGTQNILERDPKILYISIHRYDNAGFFPNSKKANYTVTGAGPGEGFNVNIPWNKKGMGDPEYIAAFQQIVMPIAYQFNPELVLVSAGFDACIGDPLGGCTVSPEAYGHLTHWLSSLANGRVILSLEGGYNVNSISYATLMCTKALLGDPLTVLEPQRAPCSSAVNTINNVLRTQKQYWPNLMFQISLPKENVLPKMKGSRNKTERRADARKTSESKIAFEELESEKLEFSLPINKSTLSMVTDEEITRLQNEIENMKIKSLESHVPNIDIVREEATTAENKQVVNVAQSGIKTCINPHQKQGSSQGGSARENDGDGQSGSAGEGGAIGNSPNNLMQYLADNMQALVDGEMFAIIPLRDCPHLPTVAEVPPGGIDVRSPCQECGSTVENWICLQCYTVHCARNINEHAVTHNQETEHPMTLSFSDLSVWCYGCDAYIDNPRLYAAKNAAHRSKFNQDLAWTYDSTQTS
ncbi:histone deacetylase 6 isoform X2 [Athalia rosae]|uniref:histone deacetylase 6 isoform X2 n=1 Tax=Athalia rosae TaxID=37344 RepID=UPI0020340252|nr:histone deacetylase 6 isoform X2 [Athalia rosae]XP_048514855.1 histone deacetylase 6 isoform X2 [Athalia rosae]